MSEKLLSKLEIGEEGKITKVLGKGPTYQRILDMGLTKGTYVKLERTAPLLDPIEIIVRGYHLSLRRKDAANIYVEVNDQK